MTIQKIETLFDEIQKSIFYIEAPLNYTQIQEKLIELCEVLNETDIDESIWYIGEYTECTLDTLLVGAFWHFTEWHEGQDSLSYAVLSSLGSIYTPNYAALDKDNPSELGVYQCLELTAKNDKRQKLQVYS